MGDARIVLTTLISEKLLAPGPKKLYVSYYRKRVYADLLPDGSIRFKDQVYTSPVPCALHMKRTLNPSLKTDAGWSSMYSAASGESLKDIKDRLNIRKRGTNARTAHKEKKVPLPSPTKEKMTLAAQAKHEAAPKCAICRKEAMTDVAECSACHSMTHYTCASLPLQEAPSAPWFCEKCLTGQADRILDFLQQTRRVLVERIAEQKEKEQEHETEKSTEAIESEEDVAREDEEEASTDDKSEDAVDTEKYKDADKTEVPTVDSEEKTEDNSNELKDETATDNAAANTSPVDDSTGEAEVATEPKDGESTAVDSMKEKEIKQEAITAVITDDAVEETPTSEDITRKDEEDETVNNVQNDAQLVVSKIAKTPSAEEKFLVLIDSLIAEVSSTSDRTNLIANSTGATLVHLEKTQLVQLVEYGKREILAAMQPESEDDDEQVDETDADHYGSTNSEVDALIKIFDLRHQILSSQSQFERTTSTLAKRTEKHLRNAESELMELEESRTVEAQAISKVVDLIDQYSSDLVKCEQKIHYNEVLLESINHRRNFIRSTNINDRFVSSYRYSTKLMSTSSDQLLLTVLLDKLRDITVSVNEWTKMECHFEKMTSNLNKSLSLIGTKRKRTGAPVKLPPTPALFAKVKIPPSRRLIERQIANYEVNLNGIRQNRARMRKTLSGILKIARDEHLNEEIINMTDLLYQKCRDLKAEEEEEQLRIKEEAEAEAKAREEEERAAHESQSTDGYDVSAEEPESKKQRVNKPGSVSNKAAPSSDVKGILSLLGSEDSDAKESNYSSAESKSRADNDDDSEGDLEQASRAIADISSVLPDIPGGSDSLLNSPPLNEKPAIEPSQGQFSIRGGKGGSDKRDQQQRGQGSKSSDQEQPSFLDQALEVLNKQQQEQQRLEQQRIEQQRQLEEQQKQLEKQQQQLEQQRQLERQRQLEQQCQLEQQRQERERQERERQERERQERERQERDRLEKQQRLERQRIEKQRQEQERREQQRREQQRLEQERREQQRIEQQHIEEQRRMEEQRRLEQQRLEQQRLEQQKRLEQQRLEQQRQEKQRQEQQLLEQQRLEQQRLEQQRKEKQRQEQQRQEQQRQEQQRRQQEQQRLELQRRQQEQQQEQQRQFQRNKASSLPQVVPPGSSHLQMLSQQQQQQLQQQAALQQQQHSRQMQHPLYGDIPKGMLMSSGMGTSQQDIYVQQAAQMGMDMHDVARHQDSGHFVGNAPGSLRGAPYDVSRSAAQQPAPTAPRTSFYDDDGQPGQIHSQDVFGSQSLPGQQRQLPDHHMFTNDLQQQQPGQSRAMVNQDFMMGRQYRGLNGNMQHPGMDQPGNNDVDMSDWGQ